MHLGTGTAVVSLTEVINPNDSGKYRGRLAK